MCVCVCVCSARMKQMRKKSSKFFSIIAFCDKEFVLNSAYMENKWKVKHHVFVCVCVSVFPNGYITKALDFPEALLLSET